MEDRNYWLAVFTVTTWEEFLEAGANVYGARERTWNAMQRVKPGDYLFCYVAGISRFIGFMEATSQPYRDNSLIWTYDNFPCRIKVKMHATLTYETAVPVQELISQLKIVSNLKDSSNWANLFRTSLRAWEPEDGKMVINAIKAAKEKPEVRPVSKSKLKREYIE